MEKYTISEKYLEELIEKGSRALVGEAMKRFELFEDNETIKRAIKELIYENYRSLKSHIKAFSLGVKFISPKQK
jgi:hypothetical protein